MLSSVPKQTKKSSASNATANKIGSIILPQVRLVLQENKQKTWKETVQNFILKKMIFILKEQETCETTEKEETLWNVISEQFCR